jgi:hypothetical protein
MNRSPSMYPLAFLYLFHLPVLVRQSGFHDDAPSFTPYCCFALPGQLLFG